VTLETVNRDSSIIVTGCAEVSVVCFTDKLTLIILDGVTGDALLEAVLLCAYAAMHGFYTLVLDELHVVVAHVISWSDTGITVALADLRQGDISLHACDEQ